MTAAASNAQRFARRTCIAPHEYHKNFHKIDEGVIAVITSWEADAITPLMSKIYLRLVNAPREFWEQKGVLRFTAQEKDGKLVKASAVLCDHLGVARATVNKAVKWMHEQGIIGYFAAKNGVGIRIFLNRATSSIGVKPTSPGEKILRFPGGSNEERVGSQNEPAFNDSFAVSENSDTDLNPHAPKNGADKRTGDKTPPQSAPDSPSRSQTDAEQKGRESARTESPSTSAGTVEEIIARLRSELEPCLKTAAAEAATQAAAREHHRTREWFETKALPKAVRVAQSESYNLFRKYGTLNDKTQRTRAELEVGRGSESFTPPQARPQSEKEILELAETCVAMLELQGKSVDVTLSEISSEGGGWLLPEDAPKVREAAERLLHRRSERR